MPPCLGRWPVTSGNDRAHEVERLLTDLESDRVERKESLSDGDKVREAICAFANDLPGHEQPGVIFIGAKDDGNCAGLQITDEILKKLAGMREYLRMPTTQRYRPFPINGIRPAPTLHSHDGMPPMSFPLSDGGLERKRATSARRQRYIAAAVPRSCNQ